MKYTALPVVEKTSRLGSTRSAKFRQKLKGIGSQHQQFVHDLGGYRMPEAQSIINDLLSGNIITAEQIPRSRQFSPEQLLLYAIFADAIVAIKKAAPDAEPQSIPRRTRNHRRDEALLWLAGAPAAVPCELVCGALGYNFDVVRSWATREINNIRIQQDTPLVLPPLVGQWRRGVH